MQTRMPFGSEVDAMDNMEVNMGNINSIFYCTLDIERIGKEGLAKEGDNTLNWIESAFEQQ